MTSTKPSSLQRLIHRWRSDPSVGANVTEWRLIPAQAAKFAPFPAELHPDLIEALTRRGITALYIHQAEAFTRAQRGEHVMVVAASAGGKSLCYHLPILDALIKNSGARALYLFPTKALAQDQFNSLNNLIHALPDPRTTEGLPISTYDGDTPNRLRPTIRSVARLLITNPDMLHVGILPHHTEWSIFFRHLHFVVIDEAHIYRGVFGSHLANVLRRLRRIAAFYGARPQFILATATLANPQEFASRLIEDKVSIVDEDGSARGPKHFVIYNPPLTDERLGLRRSALQESVRLADDLLAYGIQTIVFGRSRRTVELILRYLRESPNVSISIENKDEAIRGYRSGYLPAHRREIESGLRAGVVRLVAATNALELGVDIGGLGAAILVGYPGTISAAWQQAGRAGRGQEPAMALLIATSDPLDQFLANHPAYFWGRSVEHALINPDNILILLDHIRCAAFELPFEQNEVFGNLPPDQVKEFLEFLVNQHVLHASGGRYFWMADQYPAQSVSLRSASADSVLLQAWEEDHAMIIGQIDRHSALWMTHPGAIYLHEAQMYLVEELDLSKNFAQLRPVESDYYTLPRSETTVQHLETFAEEQINGVIKAHGELQVMRQVVGYQKVRWYTHEILAVEALDLPPTELLTTGYWLTLEDSIVDTLREEGLWRNDPNDYGANWEIQRERARRRDGFRCQVCGAPEQGRSHDVHHRQPFRLFPSYLQANQLENLVTLCPNCHHRAEATVRVRSGLAGLGYIMGHLAPFFLMCDPTDLGVHVDPASPLAAGKPAVVMYDMTPGGIGLSTRLYDLQDELLARAAEQIADCPCTDGCPSCVGPGGAGLAGTPLPGEATYGGKMETQAILTAILSAIKA